MLAGCLRSRKLRSEAGLEAPRRSCSVPLGLFNLTLAGFGGGSQSALEPAGREAEQIADLFWWMAAGSVVVWLGVVILTIYAVRTQGGAERQRQAQVLIIGGALAPTIVLAGLLLYGLALLPNLISPASAGSLKITVYGEQWWWRFRYEPRDGQAFEVANEVRLPVGEAVEFRLNSRNVIHSFWIPSLGGKADVIPGRMNRLVLHPTKTGFFRGACAEYCGAAHAQMSFYAIVMPRTEFDLWMTQQAKPAELLDLR